MRVINTDELSERLPASAICLGYFDGVHRGHLALIAAARTIAGPHGWTVCAHALDRSPAQALHPERQVPQLTAPDEKIRLFGQAGVDVLAITPFDDRVRRMPGRVFFEKILLDKLGARAIIVGDDHRFGYMGDTGSAELAQLCAGRGILLKVVPRVRLSDGSVISSSGIRSAIIEGDFHRAQEMLGRAPDDAMIRRCLSGQREAGQTL